MGETDLPDFRSSDTPSRPGPSGESLLLDVSDDEERDLQLALRLSLDESLSASSPSYKTQGLNKVDNRAMAARRAPTARPGDPLNASTLPPSSYGGWNGSSGHVVADREMSGRETSRASPTGPPDWGFASPHITRTTPTSIPSGVIAAVAKYPAAATTLPATSNVDQARTARLRHFATPTVVSSPMTLDKAVTPDTTRITLKPNSASVPVGIECIDLTDH
jgi:hypothetical protein